MDPRTVTSSTATGPSRSWNRASCKYRRLSALVDSFFIGRLNTEIAFSRAVLAPSQPLVAPMVL